MKNSEYLNHECDKQLSLIASADEVILYGKTIMRPVLEVALHEFGIRNTPIRVFDSGEFLDAGEKIEGKQRVVILCGLRENTRNSMSTSAAVYFPNSDCFDFHALSYGWMTRIVKRDCDHDILADTIIAARDERAIHNIDSINTTHCNLNCKECSNGIQYRTDKKHIPTDEHMAHLDRLTSVLPISFCNMQGGEPLMNKNFADLMRKHAQNPRVAFFTIATDGGVPPSDDVMLAVKQSGAMFRISNYGDLSRFKHQIVDKSAAMNIPCELYPRAESWVAYGELEPNNRTEAKNREIGQSCFFGTKDLMFYDGLLFCCSRTLFAEAVGLDNEATRANILDVRKEFTEAELYDIVHGTHLHLMCDYCDWPMKTVPVAEQLSRKITFLNRNKPDEQTSSK
jgi:hypothetical protein